MILINFILNIGLFMFPRRTFPVAYCAGGESVRRRKFRGVNFPKHTLSPCRRNTLSFRLVFVTASGKEQTVLESVGICSFCTSNFAPSILQGMNELN